MSTIQRRHAHMQPVDPIIHSPHNTTQRATDRLPNESDLQYQQRMKLLHQSNLLHSIIWLLAATGILYYTGLPYQLVTHDNQLNSTFYYISILLCISLILCILYIIFIVQSRYDHNMDLLSIAPLSIYIASGLSILLNVSLIITIWPIHHITSVPIVFICSMAAVLSTNFMPSLH